MIFALSKNDKIVHISNVDRGLACGCICLNCGARLIARKGDITIHHFAHYNIEECAGALETSLHKFAKDFILKSNSFKLPALDSYVEYSYENKEYGSHVNILKAKDVRFDKIVSEIPYGDTIPDITGYFKDIPLFIEIAVTHFVDEEKISKIKNIGVSTIEIDLSKVYEDIYNFSEAQVKSYISNVINKSWIFYRKMETSKQEFIDKKINLLKKEAEMLREKRNQEVKKISLKLNFTIDEYDNLNECIWHDSKLYGHRYWKQFAYFLKYNSNSIPEYLNFKIEGDGIIEVDRRLWQMILFSVYIYKYKSRQAKKNKQSIFSVKIATDFLQQTLKVPFNKTLNSSKFLLKDSSPYPELKGKNQELLGLTCKYSESMAHVVYKFFDNLLKYEFIVEIDNPNCHYFYRGYQVIYEDLI